MRRERHIGRMSVVPDTDESGEFGEYRRIARLFHGTGARYVQNKGREVIGWDELTNARIPKEALSLDGKVTDRLH